MFEHALAKHTHTHTHALNLEHKLANAANVIVVMAHRFCTKCRTTKPIADFSGRKDRAGTWRPTYCKPCCAAAARTWRKTETHASWSKKYNQLDTRKAQNAQYGQSKAGKERRKRYGDSVHGQLKISTTRRAWRSLPANRTIASMTEKLRRMITIPGYQSSALETMGVTREGFIERMEETWLDGMSWDNYGYRNGDYTGGWDVDHIIPKSLYDHADSNDVLRCWNVGNLQAKWHVDNLRKSSDAMEWKLVPAHLWPKAWNGSPPV